MRVSRCESEVSTQGRANYCAAPINPPPSSRRFALLNVQSTLQCALTFFAYGMLCGYETPWYAVAFGVFNIAPYMVYKLVTQDFESRLAVSKASTQRYLSALCRIGEKVS